MATKTLLEAINKQSLIDPFSQFLSKGQAPVSSALPMSPLSSASALPTKQHSINEFGQPVNTQATTPLTASGSGGTTAGMASSNLTPTTLNTNPTIPAVTTGGRQLTLDASGNITGVSGGGVGTIGVGTTGAGTTGTGTTGVGATDNNAKLQQLQMDLLNKAIAAMPEKGLSTDAVSAYNQVKQLSLEAKESARKLIEQEYGEAIEDETTAGGQRITQLEEARRGFATNSAVLSQAQATNDKRIRQLTKDKERALAMNNIDYATKLDNLILKEQEAMTEANTRYLTSVFDILGAVQGVAGSFEQEEETGYEAPKTMETADGIWQFNTQTGEWEDTGMSPYEKPAGSSTTAQQTNTQAEQAEITRIQNELTNYGARDYVSLGYYNQMKASSSLSPNEFDDRFSYLLKEEDRQAVKKTSGGSSSISFEDL